jgi:hypothetical protein
MATGLWTAVRTTHRTAVSDTLPGEITGSAAVFSTPKAADSGHKPKPLSDRFSLDCSDLGIYD